MIGDDGVEKIEIGELGGGKAFTLFQRWLKELQLRGILLAVCSKNDEAVAREPFISHADMVLKLEDISIFVANWNSKVDNIQYIQKQLNIGFDAMVFLDDNPYERSLVKSRLPDVTVPELPEDPSEYLSCLQALNLFESGIASENDLLRTQQIQDKIRTESIKTRFTNENDFLDSLKMILQVSGITKYNTPRIAQLSQRSNQFNLRTIRYSEEDLNRLSNDSSAICLALSLRDSITNHGLICVIVLSENEREFFIENWFMSCRVLQRGVEQAILNHMVALAKNRKLKRIVGEYLPTSKNHIVQNHYQSLGFSEEGKNRFVLDVESHTTLRNFITTEENYG